MGTRFQLAFVNAKVALGVANRPADWHEELYSKWYFKTRVDGWLLFHCPDAERGGWDTSKAHVRRVLEECIRYGRLYRSGGRKDDEYEAFRLLGTAVGSQLLLKRKKFYQLQLHTLEDFTAHSNFCELVLVSMGYEGVFTHVGDDVRIQAPNGKWVAPIITGMPSLEHESKLSMILLGSFGSTDATFSLLGGKLANNTQLFILMHSSGAIDVLVIPPELSKDML